MPGTSVTGRGTGEAGKKPIYAVNPVPKSITEILNDNDTVTVGGTDACEVAQPQSSVTTVNVADLGNDTSGDGSICKPFATIGKALASITDNSSDKKYVISVAAGTYVEPGWMLKPWVFIIGKTRILTLIQTTSNIGLDPSWGLMNKPRGGIKDLSIRGAFAAPNFDLQSLGGGDLNAVIFVEHSSFNDAPVFKARNADDHFMTELSFFFNGFKGSGGQIYIANCYSAGDFSIDSIGITDYMQTELYSNYFAAGNISIINTTSNFCVVNMFDNQQVFGTFTMTGPITFLLADALPIRSNVTIGPGVNYTRLNDAFSFAYTPANPADWAVQPVSIQDALDRIAAKIGPV